MAYQGGDRSQIRSNHDSFAELTRTSNSTTDYDSAHELAPRSVIDRGNPGPERLRATPAEAEGGEVVGGEQASSGRHVGRRQRVAPVAPTSLKEFKQQVLKSFGITSEQANAEGALIESVARR